MDCGLLIEGCAVLTMDAEYRIFDPGFVAVRDGAIVGLGPAAEAAHWTAARRIDARGRLLMPGFVNAHTHVAMAAFRGACEDLDDRLVRFIFPMEKSLVSRDLVFESTRFCLAEMARSGTTCFADMYYFEDEVARAADQVGMRCLLGETVVDFPAPDAGEAYGGIAYARRFVEDWRGHPLVSPCFAPHAPYTVDAEHLKLIWAEAESQGVPVLIPLAETEREAARFRASHGSPVKYLESIGCLGSRLVAAHMIFVDAEDIAILAERDVAVAHCPASNAKSGRPIAPAWKYRAAGLRMGLATDGPISGNGMDMMGVTGLYPKLQKVLSGRREEVSAREALRAATLGGAEALGLGHLVGSIEPGKRADLVLADTDDFNVQPVYDWYATAVYALRPHNVRTVLVDGRVIVDEGRMATIDEAEAKAAMRAITSRCRLEIARLTKELLP
ncbi:MAG TPA: amidohydrolase [Rectinemataceae bacterium]|nr:amidohydrolase [Rectinemataceae bacterium]